MTYNDGGPAFPGPQARVTYPPSMREDLNINEIQVHMNGMTLRDYFAGQVAVAAYRNHMDGTRNVERDATALASECYSIADAMLAAREQRKETP